MRQNVFFLMLAFVMMSAASVNAQVTIGEIKDPETYSILELDATSVKGGLRMPQLTTAERTALTTDPFKSAELAQGLAIFNTDTKCLEFWNGSKWITLSQAAYSITKQPEKFTFYESPEGDDEVNPLEFEVAGGGGTWAYQWYQLLGNNIHARIGTPVGGTGTIAGYSGADTKSFTPTGVIKGTNRNANNVGFYRFYCVAKNTVLGAEVTSDIAEVAVGCGAKTVDGEWLSFMCFNLGATEFTIAGQKSYEINFTNDKDNIHEYIDDEENLWGDMFQWGRVTDGHEKRDSEIVEYNVTVPPRYGNTNVPDSKYQALDNTIEDETIEYESKFIIMTDEQNHNWAYGLPPVHQDLLWRNYRFVDNDPCARIDGSGSYNTAVTGTNWRIPTVDEWSSIYKGNSAGGSPADATANTWKWYNGASDPVNSSRGFEIKPAGTTTTTLFLPASGYRYAGDGLLYNQGANAHYWSSNINGTNAYNLYFANGILVHPAHSNHRGYGFALRCIKDQ
jgi:uncharacterized protein (TIGR02145 family)